MPESIFRLMIEEKAPILTNQQLIPGMHLLKLIAPKSARESRPGQFAMIKVASGNNCMLRRPISIHCVEENNLLFLYSVIGKGTNILSQQKPGQTLSILAPLGNGFQLPARKTEILILAGGRGIAPLVFLAEKAIKSGMRIEFLIGARSAECLYKPTSLPAGTDFHLATEDGSAGYKGKITELFLSRLQGKSHVYACGPVDMYRTMSYLLSSWQEPIEGAKPRIQVSLEARMACGVGACYGCVIRTKKGTKKVCSDGPVFNLDEIIFDEVMI